MIKSEEGVVTLRGSEPFILADFTFLISSIYETFSEKYGSETAKELICQCLKDALNGGE